MREYKVVEKLNIDTYSFNGGVEMISLKEMLRRFKNELSELQKTIIWKNYTGNKRTENTN